MIRSGFFGIVALAFLQDTALGQMHTQHASEAACEEPALRCATKATPAFGPDGTLWLVWMAGGQVSVASSQDAGRSFSPPIQVTTKRLNLDWGPDARPKIVVDRRGGIALAFSIFRDEAFNGQVLYTRYIYFFQAAGLILLVSMVGAIVLTLRHKQKAKRQNIAAQVARTRATAIEIVKVRPGQGVS